MRGLDILLDELVVFGAAAAGVAVAYIERVLEQLLVIGADVQRHRNGAARVDAAAGGVQSQLADRDLNAAHPPVADAQRLPRRRCTR